MDLRQRSRIALVPCLVVLCTGPLAAQQLSPERQTALDMADALSSQMHLMAMTLWDYSEIALRETQSAEFLAALLEDEGFAVQRGVADMPTAFVASWGSGHPIIGVLAEYDALPGVGNAPVPHQVPREDGVTNGHGCGHNLFGAASVGAAIAIKRTMQRHDLDGTIRLYGTPAEETVVGKVYMAKAGAFDDLDAAFEWHPGLETKIRNQPGRALNNFTVEFFGQAAHGAGDPWNGRSALDAVEMMNYGVNMMREHVRPEARIHYVIPSAGDAPNVVPAYAKVWYFVREADRETVREYYDWILKIAEGAAMATRTTHEVTLITGVHETLLNRPLQEATQRNLEIVGAPAFSDEYREFALELQRSLGIEEKGLDTEIAAGRRAGARQRRLHRCRRGLLHRADRRPDRHHRPRRHTVAQLGYHRITRTRRVPPRGSGRGEGDGVDRRRPAHRPGAAPGGEGLLPRADGRRAVRVADTRGAGTTPSRAGIGEWLVIERIGNSAIHD